MDHATTPLTPKFQPTLPTLPMPFFVTHAKISQTHATHAKILSQAIFCDPCKKYFEPMPPAPPKNPRNHASHATHAN